MKDNLIKNRDGNQTTMIYYLATQLEIKIISKQIMASVAEDVGN